MVMLRILIVFWLGVCFTARSDNRWLGKADDRWENPANWSAGKVPSAMDGKPVVVPAVTNAPAPVVRGKGEVYDLVTIQTNGCLTVEQDAELKIYTRSGRAALVVDEGGALRALAGAKILIDTQYCIARRHNVGMFLIRGKFNAAGRPEKRVVMGGSGGHMQSMYLYDTADIELRCVDWQNSYNLWYIFGRLPMRFVIDDFRITGFVGYLNLNHQGDVLRISNATLVSHSSISAGTGNSRTEFERCHWKPWVKLPEPWGLETGGLIQGWVISRHDVAASNAYVFYPGWQPVDWHAASQPPGTADDVIIRNGLGVKEERWVRLTNSAQCRSVTINAQAGLDLNGQTLECESVINRGTIWLNGGRLIAPKGGTPAMSGEGQLVKTAPPLRNITALPFGFTDSEQQPAGPAPTATGFPWGRSYAAGQPKVLFLTTDVAAREIYELNHRFDLKAKVLVFPPSKEIGDIWHDQYASGDVLQAVLENESFDCVVSYGLSTASLGEIGWQLIVNLVESNGAGYVAVCPTDHGPQHPLGLMASILPEARKSNDPWLPVKPHYITDGFPFSVMPRTFHPRRTHMKGDLLIAAGTNSILSIVDRNAQGRLVNLVFGGHVGWGTRPPTLPFPVRDGPQGLDDYHHERTWDYWELFYSLLGRTIIWASRKDPPARINAIHPTRETVIREKHEPLEITVTMSSDAGWNGRLKLVLADGQFNRINEQASAIALPPGQPAIITQAVTTAQLSAGRYFVIAQLETPAGAKTDWGVTSFEVAGAASIVNIEAVSPWPQSEQAKAGNVLISVTNRTEALFHGRLAASLYDGWNRLLWTETHSVDAAGLQGLAERFTIPTPAAGPATGYHRLQVELADDYGIVERKNQTMWVKLNPADVLDDFVVGVWPGSSVHPHLKKAYYDAARAEWGASFVVVGGDDADLAEAVNGIWTVHENVWFLGKGDCLPGGIRKMCLSDPKVIQGGEKKVKAFVERRKDLPMLLYAIGEEMMLGKDEVCFSSWCQARYCQWLQRQYGTLENLNACWRSRITSWEEIKGARSADIPSLPSLAPFVDFRLFMEEVWADAFRQFNGWVQQADPSAWPGYDCSDYADSVFDGWGGLARIGPITDMSVEYYHPWSLEILRCTMKRPYLLVTGYYYGEANYRFIPWWVAFHGGGGVSYYEYLSYFRHFTPYYGPNAHTRRVRDVTRDLREGVGKILLTSRRENDGLAIFYSRPSIIAGWAKSYQKTGSGVLRHPDAGFLRNLQLQADYITEQQFAKGGTRGFTTLFLLSSAAMSDAQFAAITAFVEAGGTVVADLGTGLYNEHGGLPRDQSRLERLFGIHRQGTNGVQVVKEQLAFDDSGKRVTCTSLGKEALTLTNGTAWTHYRDGTPAMIEQRVGKGRTLYLNGLINDTGFWQAALPRLGIPRSAITLTTTNSAAEKTMPEVVRFTRGALEYIGVLTPLGAKQGFQGSIAFGRACHVYDVRRKTYLGRVERVACELEEGGAALYMLAPYQVKAVGLKVPARAAPGDCVAYKITVQPSEGTAGDHIVRLAVYPPGGGALPGGAHPVYTRNMVVTNGVYHGVWPLALNEQTGKWRLTLTEVASGVTQEKIIRIKERQTIYPLTTLSVAIIIVIILCVIIGLVVVKKFHMKRVKYPG